VEPDSEEVNTEVTVESFRLCAYYWLLKRNETIITLFLTLTITPNPNRKLSG